MKLPSIDVFSFTFLELDPEFEVLCLCTPCEKGTSDVHFCSSELPHRGRIGDATKVIDTATLRILFSPCVWCWFEIGRAQHTSTIEVVRCPLRSQPSGQP